MPFVWSCWFWVKRRKASRRVSKDKIIMRRTTYVVTVQLNFMFCRQVMKCCRFLKHFSRLFWVVQIFFFQLVWTFAQKEFFEKENWKWISQEFSSFANAPLKLQTKSSILKSSLVRFVCFVRLMAGFLQRKNNLLSAPFLKDNNFSPSRVHLSSPFPFFH